MMYADTRETATHRKELFQAWCRKHGCAPAGELLDHDWERLVAYYASGLDMPANFHLLTCEWSAPALAELIERYEAALPEGAWPNWVLGNHDRPRVVSRLGAAQAPGAGSRAIPRLASLARNDNGSCARSE